MQGTAAAHPVKLLTGASCFELMVKIRSKTCAVKGLQTDTITNTNTHKTIEKIKKTSQYMFTQVFFLSH